MKMIFTEKEVGAITGAIKAIGIGVADSFSILGEKVDVSMFTDGITDEAIEQFNNDTNGLITITKDNGLVTIEYNEEFIITSTELMKDFIVDFFDVIKYGIKTFVAFGAVKLTAYREKIENLMKGGEN